jgi:hypothetical protein
MSLNAPTPPKPLDYGRDRPSFRWRRWVVAAFVASVTIPAVFIGSVRFDQYLKRQAGIRIVTTWYQAARTCEIPPGTLLYSAYFPDAPTRGWSVTFEDRWPLLRSVERSRENIPRLTRDDVLFVHERDIWKLPDGKEPQLVCVSYPGIGMDRRPIFRVWTYRLTDLQQGIFQPAMSGSTYDVVESTRPLTNIRIYAGRADPVDLTRFTLPFDCDGGHGRFEFKTDNDATDGGKPAPDVWIEWDDVPATNPSATRPSTDPSPTNH